MADNTRRLNKDGSLYFHKGRNRWVAQVTNPLNGKRVTKYAMTKPLANKELKRIIKDLESGNNPHDKTLIKTFLADFVKSQRLNKPATYDAYKSFVTTHLIPRFGTNKNGSPMKLQDLTADIIQAEWDNMADEGHRKSLIEHCHITLSTALNTAIPTHIQRNPCLEVRKKMGSRLKAVRKDIRFLNHDEIKLLLTEAKERTEYYPIMRMNLATAMRRGELCAVTWRDIDWDKGMVTVSKSAYYTNGMTKIDLPKNGLIRSIHLEPDTLEFLEDYRYTLEGNGLLYGYKVKLDSHIFLNPLTGTNMLTSSYTRGMTRLTKAIGITKTVENKKNGNSKKAGISPHSLRHTFASLHLANNMPMIVLKEIMGHADIRTTVAYYGHLMPNAQKDALAGWKLPL